jgi:hypothetical protein
MEAMENNTANRITRLLFFAIFILSASLRIALAVVNREANDDHMQVIQLALETNRLPLREDCWECFQPKLYYVMVTTFVHAAGIYSGAITPEIIVTAQIVNALMGIILMAVAWIFLESVPVQNNSLKVAAFALTAFNPKLIAINAQASNDTLAILLATLAMYSALLFLRKEKISYLVACIVFISLGLAAKTNLLVMAAAIMVAFLVKAYFSRQRSMLVAATVFLSSVFIFSFINPLTQYRVNLREYGSVVTMNRGIARHPFPSFFTKTYFERPGITSIADGFFTFKYINLLEYPRMTNGMSDYPDHRTSLWTHLFAYAHSVHFDNWPQSWESSGSEYFTLTRAIFILALPPSILILIGAGMNLFKFFAALFKRSNALLRATDYGLFDAAFWGHIAFLILYSMMYRDFSLMKTIYIYPALLSFLIAFIQSGNMLLKSNKWFTTSLASIAAILVALYITDVAALVIHLRSLLQ